MSNFLKSGKKIVAIGRNYKAHALELKNAVPKEPFFFLKPTTSYVAPAQGAIVEIPKGVIVHHEIELGVVIGKGGRDITEARAMDHVAGYTLAIDMTARNVQDAVKAKGLPWSMAKGFDTFNPVSGFVDKSKVADPHAMKLWLAINGTKKQDGTTSDMIFQIPKLIEFVSGVMTLEEGDLLLTGTPAGVGAINAGDKITGALVSPEGEEVSTIAVEVVDRQGGYEFVEKK